MKNFLQKTLLPVLAACIWISISEFVRNEVLFKSYWTNHYQNLGVIFPSEPINGAIWGLWSLFFAIALFIISTKFNLLQTTFIGWFMAFVMMWVVLGNMAVLPYGLLIYATPLSILETWLASFIIKKLSNHVK